MHPFTTTGCPYSALTEGPVLQRLAEKQKKLSLLDFLLTELQATRMLAINKPAALSTAPQPAVETVFLWRCYLQSFRLRKYAGIAITR